MRSPFAIVRNASIVATGVGQVAAQETYPVLDRNYRTDEPPEVLNAAGIYSFSHVPQNPPASKKVGELQTDIDNVNGIATQYFTYIDMSADEIKAAHNDPIDAAIKSLEQEALDQGLVRYIIEDALTRALLVAAGAGVTQEQLLDPESPHYSAPFTRFYDNEMSRAVLRAQRKL